MNKNSKYYTVFLLSTDFEKLAEGKYKLLDEDGSGALDKGFRLKAAELLYKHQITKRIVIVGGQNKIWNEWRPDIEELKLKGKIPNYVIEKLYCNPGNTCGNAKSIIEYISDNRIWEQGDQIGILTNRYHLPRILALIEKMVSEFKEISDKEKIEILSKLKKIAAEDVMLALEVKGKIDIARLDIEFFYKQGSMRKREKSEKMGLQQIKDKKYECSWN